MRLLLILLSLAATVCCHSQSFREHAERIRRTQHMPELGYAVVTADSILELEVLGIRKAHSSDSAKVSDRFRIGSNTKAITGFIAAQLVASGKITRQTEFFSLFPEMKRGSNPAYHKLTLLNLLSFRTRLIPYTYTDARPTRGQFTGNAAAQRYQFTKWCFQQSPVSAANEVNTSNAGYVAAGLMLEKVSGKSYEQLVAGLGSELNIRFGFGQPNAGNAAQPWGHDGQLRPEPPGNNYKLSWLLAAGNINLSLPDYARFIRLQLQGLQGRSQLLPKEAFHFLHYGLPQFSIGWRIARDDRGRSYSYNIGNPGTFLTRVYVFGDSDRAIILFSNAQTSEADAGLDELYDLLYRKYLH